MIRITGPRAGGPLDRALRRIERYDWVVATSANGVRSCLNRARALGIDLAAARVRWAAIGPATSGVLRGAGIRVAMTPRRYLTSAIARELREVAGRRVLLPRADVAPPALAQALRARGAVVDEVTAYRTALVPSREGERLRRLISEGRIDTVLFTSASTVRGLVRLLGRGRRALAGLTIACIGPVTAAAVVDAGLRPHAVAATHTTDGLIRALLGTDRKRRTRGGRHGANGPAH
jgi:uroporphyrinogen III methyltransferase/synthase